MTSSKLREVQSACDPREDTGYTGTKQSKNYNDNNRNQNNNQRILDQTLTFFLRGEQHFFSPSFLLRIALFLKANDIIAQSLQK
jgi:hypothetical protein